MNFKTYIEMTMNYANDNFLSMQDFSDSEHIGDIERSKVLYKKINNLFFYAITNDVEIPVGWVQTQNKNISGKNYLEIKNIFVEKEFRGQNYAKKLLFFLRNVEKQSFVFGDTQSELGRELVKSIGRSKKFPMFWLNIKNGEKHDYNPEKDNPNIKPYRSFLSPTEWVVISEGLLGESFLSRFHGEMGVDPNYWNKFKTWFE